MNLLDHLDAQIASWFGQLGLEGAHRHAGVSLVRGDHTFCTVTLVPDGADEAWIRFVSVVLTDAHASVALLHRILQLNHEVATGAFQLFDDGTVVYAVSEPASGLDADRFSTLLRYAVHVADRAVVDLEPLAGGRRGLAPLDEVPR